MQQKQTVKLFWGKYQYKLVLYCDITHVFSGSLGRAQQLLSDYQKEHRAYSIHGRPHKYTPENLHTAAQLLNFLLCDGDYKTRSEFRTFSVYSNDAEALINLAKQVTRGHAREFWKPLEGTDTVLSNDSIILKNRIDFAYRVTLGAGKNQGFAVFVENNPNLIKIGKVLLTRIKQGRQTNGSYFYARDKKTLHLCELLLPQIRKIEKIIFQEDILT